MPVPLLNRFINKRFYFWLTQLLFWALFLVAELLSQLSYIYHDYHSPAISIIIFNAVLGFVFSTPLRYLYKTLSEKKPWEVLSLILFGCLLMATFWTLGKNGFFSIIDPKRWNDVHYSVYFIGLINAMFILLCWSGAYFTLKLYLQDQKNKQKMILLKAETQEAKLQMLRYQLNPHFLFNTINSISCLIKDQKNSIADEMLTKLSELLRFTLDSSPIDMVTIDEELSLINRYLQIEKLRFSDRLNLDVQIQDNCHHCLVPSLLLQPLVENAIKHAVAKNKSAGRVTIMINIIDQRLIISVSNTGSIKPEKMNLGVGLSNLNKRLESIYLGDSNITYFDKNKNEFTVKIDLPIHKSA